MVVFTIYRKLFAQINTMFQESGIFICSLVSSVLRSVGRRKAKRKNVENKNIENENNTSRYIETLKTRVYWSTNLPHPHPQSYMFIFISYSCFRDFYFRHFSLSTFFLSAFLRTPCLLIIKNYWIWKHSWMDEKLRSISIFCWAIVALYECVIASRQSTDILFYNSDEHFHNWVWTIWYLQ
jgi:hypothetical protein